MQPARRYLVIFILGYILILFSLWSFLAYRVTISQKVPPPPPIPQKTYSLSDYMEPPKPEIRARDWDTVGVYYNAVGHYRVNYPGGNFSINADAEKDKTIPTGITFWGNNDARIISVLSQPTTATSALQALLDVKDGEGRNEYIFEKMVAIDKYPAAMGHLYWNGVEISDVKMVYFIKDHELYQIFSEYVDHERIWNSFRFEE